MNAKLLIVACSSLAQVVSSDASTRAWWHFNGADGASASSPLMDYNGAFGLQLRKQGTATAGMVTYISPTSPTTGTCRVVSQMSVKACAASRMRRCMAR